MRRALEDWVHLHRASSRRTQARDRGRKNALVRRSCVLLLLAAIVTAGGVPSHGQDGLGDENEVVVTLSGESLPPALRLSAFTGYLVAYVEKDVHAAHAHLHRLFGISLSSTELLSLVGLYGDFTTARRQYYEHQFSKPELLPDERTALGRSQVMELLQYEGGVLGEWTALLRENGHDVDQFLWDVVHEPKLAISQSFSGDVPTAEALTWRAKIFESAFRKTHGRSLQQILRQDEPQEGS